MKTIEITVLLIHTTPFTQVNQKENKTFIKKEIFFI